MLLLNMARELVVRKQAREVMVPTSAPAATRATVNLLLNMARELVVRKQAREVTVPTSAPAATRVTVNHCKVARLRSTMSE
jgi:hypothetical protein